MDRVVRRMQLLELIGVSSTTQWRMERAGEFPARVKIGKGLVGWHLTEVEKWLENRERVSGSQLGIDSKLPLCLGAEQSKNKEG